MRYLIKLFMLGALLYLILSAPAKAEEPVRLMAPNALVCDSIEEVIETIELRDELAEGCGLTQLPLWVTVIPQTVFVAHGRGFKLVQYDFPKGEPDGSVEIWTQYGFWGTPEPVEQLGEST